MGIQICEWYPWAERGGFGDLAQLVLSSVGTWGKFSEQLLRERIEKTRQLVSPAPTTQFN